ncbi:MAG: diguanylate cyclase domain-containing protein [Kiloniellales bacterium]
MPKIAHVLVASGDPMERTRLDGMFAGEDIGCLMADGAAEVAPLARDRRPETVLLSGSLGEEALGALIDELKGDREVTQIPIMLVVSDSSEQIRECCVGQAVEELVEGPLDEVVILARLRPLIRLATLRAEAGLRIATARDLGRVVEMPERRAFTQEDCRVLIVGPPGAAVQAITPALGSDLTVDLEADPYRAGAAVERTRYDALVLVVEAGVKQERSLYLASHIRHNPSLFNLPVLMIYGDDVLAQPRDAYRAGASIALPQPVDPGLLRASLMMLVQRQRLRWWLRGALELTLSDTARERGTAAYDTDFLRAHLKRLIAAARRRDCYLTLAVFSIRNLEDIEHRHGPAGAGLLMTKVADWIAGLVRAEDLTGYLGGPEICTLLPDTGASLAQIVVHRVSAVLHHSDFALAEEAQEPIRVWVGGGAASLHDSDSVDDLIERARANTL